MPDRAAVHNNLGNVLTGSRRFDEAIVAFQKALRINPDFAEAHYNLGIAWRREGDSARRSCSTKRP